MKIPASILAAGVADQGYGLWYGNGRLAFESPGLTLVVKQDSDTPIVRVGNPKALIVALEQGFAVSVDHALYCRSQSSHFRLRAEEDLGHRMDITVSGHVPMELPVAKALLGHLLPASHFGPVIWVGGDRLKDRLVSVIEPGVLYVGILPVPIDVNMALHPGNSRLLAKLFEEPTRFMISQRSTLVSNGEFFAQSQHLEPPVPVKITKLLRSFRPERLRPLGTVLSEDLFPLIRQLAASCEHPSDLVSLELRKDSLSISLDTGTFAFQSEIPGNFPEPCRIEILVGHFSKVQHLTAGEIQLGSGAIDVPHVCFFQQDRMVIASRSAHHEQEKK